MQINEVYFCILQLIKPLKINCNVQWGDASSSTIFFYYFSIYKSIHEILKINLNPGNSGLSHAINRPDMDNDVMTKKTKRMESQTTLSIRECEMEEETDDKMFVRFIQETLFWRESDLSN